MWNVVPSENTQIQVISYGRNLQYSFLNIYKSQLNTKSGNIHHELES